MYVKIARDREALRKRVMRLMAMDRSPSSSTNRVRKVTQFLEGVGKSALVGGAIRDLAFGGRKIFASDLDFVVYDSDVDKFRRIVRDMSLIANKFGGYSIVVASQKIDFWHIQDTWARSSGARTVNNLSDLIKCTFFDWDSVAFDLECKSLVMDSGYLDRLKSGTVDIALRQNPNPRGAFVRAVRRAAIWDISFSPTLADFCLDVALKSEWTELVFLDRSAFFEPVLEYLRHDVLKSRLREAVDSGTNVRPVPDWTRSPELPFARVRAAEQVGPLA